MNLDSLSFTLSEISYLVASITKKNHKQVVADLSKLVNLHGLEADRHLLQCLFLSVDFTEASTKLSALTPQNQVLLDYCNVLVNKPALISSICNVTDNALKVQKVLKLGPHLFQQLSKCLRLSAVQEVIFAIAFLYFPNPEVVNFTQTHLKTSVPALVQTYIDTEGSGNQHEGGLHETSPEVLHLILSVVLKSPKDFGLSSDLHISFLNALKRDFNKDLVPIILAPLVYPEECELAPEMSTDGPGIPGGNSEPSISELISEIGYGFTSSVDECRNNLLKLNNCDITPTLVARILSAMCRTVTGLEDTVSIQTPGSFNKGTEGRNSWNVEVFIQAVKEVSPAISFSSVIYELDHSEFLIKDRQSLVLLMNAIRLGLQSTGFHSETFPIDHFYRRWLNLEGQLSLFKHVFKNPDVFSFADYPCSLVQVDSLKTPPEQDIKDMASWRSLNLVELLLTISECGLYQQVQDLFKQPMQISPDVLVLSLLQIPTPVTILRQDLLTNLFPLFLGSHPNSAIILHYAWHTAAFNVKPIIMHSMAEWYARGDYDQARLSRILDVAQDLKALSILLNAQPYTFIIDLACLASRREYLKLEKWFTDKIREHGEGFILACIKFLHRRCPQIIGKSEEQLNKAHILPNETLTTMIYCLHSNMHLCAENSECPTAIIAMSGNCALVIKNRQQQQQPATILRSHRGLETAFNPTSLTGPIYNTNSVEPITNLGTSLGTINLGAPSSSAFNLPGGLGQLVQSPSSPSRILGAGGHSNSPFPIIPLHQGPVGTGSSMVTNTIGALGRMGPNPSLEKPRIQETSLFPEMSTNVSKDIEDEANSYFQRIYNHPPHPTLSIDEVLEMLKQFQDSPKKREREVFNCMLRNLFEEYRFFPQYPDKELHITAQLFGGIIERGLVTSYMALGLALRFVLDALRKSEGSKMYYFGIAALDRFKSRLKDYHKYCEHVRAIQHFNEFPPHLIEYVEYGLQSSEPPTKPQGPVLPASLSSMLNPTQSFKTTIATTVSKPATSSANTLGSRPSIANATNIDTLLVATEKEEKMTSPPESLQDKIAFIFNNLSQLNLQKKCDELRDIVSDEHWPWISQYFVMKRASIELNFHALYSNFLDVLKVPEVNKLVTTETFRNIKVLLKSDKVMGNFSDRSLLKNLGHWLGIMTLGRNKPILQIDLDIKSLLIEAYHKGQQELLYIVPFIAKILESCSKSRVFKPPNPWTMAIMNALAEMHQELDLKLNLKFEIEVLCKTLELDITQLKPNGILKNPDYFRKVDYQLQNQGTKKEIAQTTSQLNLSSNSALIDAELVSVSRQSTATPPVVQNNSSTPTSALVAPEPRFSYNDINLNLNVVLQTNVTVTPAIVLFQNQPHLKSLVKPSVERAVQEWIAPVVDRSIKIALQTCEQIIRKDFALDPDENRMRSACHYMVRNLTAGMAMITCRDQLLASINTQMKLALQNALVNATPQQKDMMDQAANVIAQDNMELGCAFIQKTAIEKAIPEIDKRLMNEFELRKNSRHEGRRYCDAIALTYQAERMPEHIRLKVGGITPPQMTVYEEFARNIPGFLPLSERDNALFLTKPAAMIEPQQLHPSTPFQIAPTAVTSDDLASLYEKLALDVDQFVQGTNSQSAYGVLHSNMVMLRDCIMYAMHNREMGSAITIVQKCVEALQDGATNNETDAASVKFKEIIIRVLKNLQDPRAFGQQWINKNVTRFVIDFREELRFNEAAAETLIRHGLVNMPQFDLALAQCMENGPNYRALNLATVLIQNLLIEDRANANQFVTETDFCNSIDMMNKINMHARQPPEALTNILDMLKQHHEQASFFGDRTTAGPIVHIHTGILQVRAPNYEDPPGLVEKTDLLIRDWINTYNAPSTSRDTTKNFSFFVQQMNLHGILKNDDLITRFIRLSTQLCIESVYRNMNDQSMGGTYLRVKCFNTLDAFVKLVALLVKHSGDSSNAPSKIHLLSKILGIVAGCLFQDHEQRTVEFQQFPYHRIFIMLFLELNASEPVLETINLHVLTAYCHTLHILRPSKAAGFCYAWLELVSHRLFMGRMLASTPQQKGWAMYAQLLIDLFKYLAPFLRNAELAKPVTMLYKGTLRVLLVLLHDFPEFLCDYHYSFCDVIPPNCIQMRNLILSAFPRNMRLPDPFTPNLKVDILQEIAYAPRVLTNYASLITPATFKKDLDSYLKLRAPVTFLSELRSNLQISNEPGMRYNIPLMNALVLYVGTQAIAYIRGKSLTPNMTTIAHSAHMDIFQNLAVDLDTEGRYLFLNSIANQLRYPNSHTHYFSCTLLYLFAEANTEAIQEQITRVLLERLIVNRPHPWGLLITFIELIKNPNYKFWTHEFVHCASEIEKLFESVARSCFVQKTTVQVDGDINE